jgi:hypothetical protein
MFRKTKISPCLQDCFNPSGWKQQEDKENYTVGKSIIYTFTEYY